LSTSLASEPLRKVLIKNANTPRKIHLLKIHMGERAAELTAQRNRSGGRATGESRNSAGTCSDQLLLKIWKLSGQLGHTPSDRELRAAGLYRSTLKLHFGSVRAAFEILGLTPRPAFGIYGRKALVGFMVNFIKRHGRRPFSSDAIGGVLPNKSTYLRNFGGFRKAVAIALKQFARET
jgi:hypothetical protein